MRTVAAGLVACGSVPRVSAIGGWNIRTASVDVTASRCRARRATNAVATSSRPAAGSNASGAAGAWTGTEREAGWLWPAPDRRAVPEGIAPGRSDNHTLDPRPIRHAAAKAAAQRFPCRISVSASEIGCATANRAPEWRVSAHGAALCRKR